MAAQEYTPAVIQALLDGPADTPPAGTTSNFNVKPPYNSQGNAIVAVCAALVVLVGGLRAYSRLRVTRTMFLEDCTSAHAHMPRVMVGRLNRMLTAVFTS